MKTTILTIAIALASALSALAQTVMRENSTVYFQTNVYLHDDSTNALHTRISVEGQEPLWVAASNHVAYYHSGAMTNAWIHTRYLHATNISNADYISGTSSTMVGTPDPMRIRAASGGNPVGPGKELWIEGGASFASGHRYGKVIIKYDMDVTSNLTSQTIISSNSVTSPLYNFNSTARLQSDGTNLFFVSTVGTGFTNALTTNTP